MGCSTGEASGGSTNSDGTTTGSTTGSMAASTGSSSSGGATNSTSTASSTTTSGTLCSNVRPTGTEWDEATCDQWASETTECDNAWMVDNDYCNESCGRCTPGGTPSNASTTSTATSTTGGTGPCNEGAARAGGQQHCSNTQGSVGNGYDYEYWSDGSGSGCMTVFGDDATFKATWSDVGDFLARVGLKYDETRTASQIGIFSSDFAFTGSADETTYIGIYGWSNNPLIEYYIIEDWFGDWQPSFETNKGTITVDGGSYDVYTNVRTNSPSIHGTQTFTQYYSVRTEGRQCGHISISDHFSEWQSLGMQLGDLYEVTLLVEGLNDGTGEVEFTNATVVVQ